MPHRKVLVPSLTKSVLEQILAESSTLIQERTKQGAAQGFISEEPASDKLKRLYEKYCLWSTIDYLLELSLETTDIIVDVSGGPYRFNEGLLFLKPYSIERGELFLDTLAIPINTIMGHHLVPLSRKMVREPEAAFISYADSNQNTA